VTYPHFPFPNHTDLFPHWTVILKYLQDYAQTFGLYGSPDSAWDTCCQSYPEASVQSTRDPPQLKFSNTSPDAARKELPRRVLRNRELYSASWEGSTELGGRGRWKTISKPFPRKFDCTEEYQDEFDAIIDGTGHLVHPSIPHWQGEELWLAANEKRRIMHSAFYRGPAAFKDETVLIIGAGYVNSTAMPP
jgi:cation diffusion facilitator CzcD-associated flavoprotein CzcO